MREARKAGSVEEGGLQCWRGLLGKGGSASLSSPPGSTVCPASEAGRQGGGCREGLYLPRAVVQIHQDVQGLEHSAHRVDDD